MRPLLALLILPFLCACMPGVSFVEQPDANNSLSQNLDPMACLANTPDFQLNTSIDSFQLTGGANGNVGFNPGGILQAIGVNVTYSTGDLEMAMNITTPLFGTDPIAHSTGKGVTNNFSIGTTGLVALLTGNIGAWQSTGLYDASQGALTDTFGNLKAGLPALPTWSTVVSAKTDQGFLIPVGTASGVKVGDQFNVYKVNYVWQADNGPCKSPLKIALKLTNTPFATLTVTQAELRTASVTASLNDNGTGVELYDRVEIKKLKNDSSGNTRTALNYSIRLGSLTQSANLAFTDGRTTQIVDMTPFVRNQLSDLVANKIPGYFLVP